MNVRDFERLLAQHGAAPASLDALTRHLRSKGLLPVGGRGPNAPAVSLSGAAIILLSLAGVTNPNSREQVSSFLEELGFKSDQNGSSVAVVNHLATALGEISKAAQINELRVCRSRGDITFTYRDGSSVIFRSLDEVQLLENGAERASFRVEGVISHELLIRASSALSGRDSH